MRKCTKKNKSLTFFLSFFYFLPCRGAKLIPEIDQIFTDVELKTLEKVINDTTVSSDMADG